MKKQKVDYASVLKKIQTLIDSAFDGVSEEDDEMTPATTDDNDVKPSIPAQYSKNDVDKMDDAQVFSLGLKGNSANFSQDAQTEIQNRITSRIQDNQQNKFTDQDKQKLQDDIIKELEQKQGQF